MVRHRSRPPFCRTHLPRLRRVPFLRLPVRARQAREAVGGCQSRAPVLLGHASSHGCRAGRPGRLHHRRGALPRAARTRSYDDLSVARHRRRRRGRSRVGARAPHPLPQELLARLAGMGRFAPGGGRPVAWARDDQFTGKTAGKNAPGQCVHRRRRCCLRCPR